MTETADPWPAPRVHEPVDVVVDLPGSKSLANRALVLAAILVPFFRLKSSIEERWLEQRFAGYDAYRDRTGRFIARLG